MKLAAGKGKHECDLINIEFSCGCFETGRLILQIAMCGFTRNAPESVVDLKDRVFMYIFPGEEPTIRCLINPLSG
jgi:hypothetical protein